jgi:hypothetical protein
MRERDIAVLDAVKELRAEATRLLGERSRDSISQLESLLYWRRPDSR